MSNERQKVDLRKLHERGQVINLSGKKFTTYAGLLELAHEAGIQSIVSKMERYDHGEGLAIFTTTASGSRGSYTGWGDATRKGAKRGMEAAFLRMAETRSIARALRLYLGCGMTAHEELPGNAQRGAESPPPARGQVRQLQPNPPEPRRIAAKPGGARPNSHPSWARESASFSAALGTLGLTYEKVATHCRENGWPVPSGWPSEDRARFITDLTCGKMPDLHEVDPIVEAEE